MQLKKLFLFFLILLGILNAQSQVFRKYSNEFLNLGAGADAFGMGKAVVASTKGVDAGYWNPAGLVNIKDNELSLMHAAYFQGIANYDYAAYAIPLDRNSTLAFYALRFGVDDILNTTALPSAMSIATQRNGIGNESKSSTVATGNNKCSRNSSMLLPRINPGGSAGAPLRQPNSRST